MLSSYDRWLTTDPDEALETEEEADPICPSCGLDEVVTVTRVENRWGTVRSWDCPRCGFANEEES